MKVISRHSQTLRVGGCLLHPYTLTEYTGDKKAIQGLIKSGIVTAGAENTIAKEETGFTKEELKRFKYCGINVNKNVDKDEAYALLEERERYANELKEYAKDKGISLRGVKNLEALEQIAKGE